MERTILVVDEEANMLALYRRVLGKEGYRLICVRNEAEALALASNRRFHLAIVEPALPQTDRVAFLTALRQRCGTTPLIVVSAEPPWQGAESARQLGCAAYLVKPLDIRQLKDLVQSLVAG